MDWVICKTAITLAAPLSPSIFLWTGSDLKYFTYRVGALSFGHNCGFRGKARVGYRSISNGKIGQELYSHRSRAQHHFLSPNSL
jgi:hypothetical protein